MKNNTDSQPLRLNITKTNTAYRTSMAMSYLQLANWDSDDSEFQIPSLFVFQTQNHFPYICLSVIYY